MDYSKIRLELKKRGLDFKYFIVENTDMTPDGFRLACKNDTLKVRTLEQISKALEIPTSFWFDDVSTKTENDIKHLTDLLEECRDDKRRLKKMIDE